MGDLLLGYFLLWSALVALKKLGTMCAKKDIATSIQCQMHDNQEAAHLAGKIDSARFFIGTILSITDGKIAALQWGDISAWEIMERSL